MNKGCRARRKMLIGAALLLSPAWAGAVDIQSSWALSTSGSWTDSTKWTTNPAYPHNNGGNTYKAFLQADVTVTLDAPITINSLDFGDGTLTGANTLTLQSASRWINGSIATLSLLKVNSSLEINGLDHQLSLSTIEISSTGSVQWLGGDIHADNESGGGGTINNAGIWDDQTDVGYTWVNLLAPVFNNTGTYTKSLGTVGSKKAIWAAFNNSGFVDVQGGDLWLLGGGNNTGSIAVNYGARLGIGDFNQFFSEAGAPTTTFSSAASIFSNGAVIFDHSETDSSFTLFSGTYDSNYTIVDAGTIGEVTFDASASISTNIYGDLQMLSGTLRLNTLASTTDFNHVGMDGGTINTTSNMYMGHLSWDGGAIVGFIVDPEINDAIDVTTDDLTFTGTNPKYLVDVDFFNGVSSNATISEGDISMKNAKLANLAGGIFDFQGDANIVNSDAGNSNSVFINSGTMVKSGGVNTSELLDVEMVNHGTVHIQSGTLRFNGGGTHYGTTHIDSGATLELGSGTSGSPHNFQSGAVITGDANSEVHIIGDVAFLPGTTTQVDRMHIEWPGHVTYEGGTLATGALSLTGGAHMVMTAGADKTLKTKSITMPQFSESSINLNDNRAIVDFDTEPNVLGGIRNLIIAGFNGGGWDGEGITSSMADSTNYGIGYADNNVLHRTSFGGYAVDDSSVLIKYTYYGDANLDGMVDMQDLQKFIPGFNHTNKLWTDGDFDYDGDVDRMDLGFLARNWQAGVGNPLGGSLGEAMQSLGLPDSLVPEPVGLSALAFIMWSIPRRRRAIHP